MRETLSLLALLVASGLLLWWLHPRLDEKPYLKMSEERRRILIRAEMDRAEGEVDE